MSKTTQPTTKAKPTTIASRPNKHYDKAREIGRNINTLGWLMTLTNTDGIEVDEEFSAQLRAIGFWLSSMSEELGNEIYLSQMALRAEMEGAR